MTEVDIDFPRRHALIFFLLNSLVKCHFQHAKRRLPEESERLQMIPSNELELLYFQSVNRTRQVAVHHSAICRWSFDRRIIRSAAGCAQDLSYDALVEKIELLKVLYVDAGGKSELTVTEDERTRAYDLLRASDRRLETTHQLYSTRFRIWQRSPVAASMFGCTTTEQLSSYPKGDKSSCADVILPETKNLSPSWTGNSRKPTSQH